jgi:hypothetical protein
MEITNIRLLYRYENADGSISITPIKRNEGDEIYSYRLIADEGYELYYNGENQHATVIDVEAVDGWTQEPIEDIEPIGEEM